MHIIDYALIKNIRIKLLIFHLFINKKGERCFLLQWFEHELFFQDVCDRGVHLLLLMQVQVHVPKARFQG